MKHGSYLLTFAFLGLALASPAHADAPKGRYTISGGTVKDNKTGLLWQQTAPTTGGPNNNGRYSWSAAQAYCVNLALDGSGWRLPTIKELATLVDPRKPPPSIDTNAFPPDPAGTSVYWSKTLVAGDATRAWLLDLTLAGSVYPDPVTDTVRVRCVR